MLWHHIDSDAPNASYTKNPIRPPTNVIPLGRYSNSCETLHVSNIKETIANGIHFWCSPHNIHTKSSVRKQIPFSTTSCIFHSLLPTNPSSFKMLDYLSLAFVVAVKVFKKTTPNGKVTVYLGKRDFIDHIDYCDPVDGVVVVDTEYLKGRKVYSQVY